MDSNNFHLLLLKHAEKLTKNSKILKIKGKTEINLLPFISKLNSKTWHLERESHFSNLFIFINCSQTWWWNTDNPAGIYLLKVNNRKTTARCETCSKLTIKKPERRQWRRYGVFIVNFEHSSHLVLVFLLLTLNMSLPAGKLQHNYTCITPSQYKICLLRWGEWNLALHIKIMPNYP